MTNKRKCKQNISWVGLQQFRFDFMRMGYKNKATVLKMIVDQLLNSAEENR